jgi:glycosyltransferase involved in cell wall biosynthesis
MQDASLEMGGTTALPDDPKSVAQLVEAVERYNTALAGQGRQIRKLETQLAQLIAMVAGLSGTATAAPALDPKRKTINWVIGPADNIAWAYGNNAKRLAAKLKAFNHTIAGKDPSDIAVYFDAVVAERFEVKAKKSILRIGGPRPLDRLYGDDIEKLRQGLAKFDAIIALSGELYLRAAKVHPRVYLVPNALNLSDWKPIGKKTTSQFTVGFAASLKSSAEIEVKGESIARGAVARVGATLLTATKGNQQIPHDKMRSDFYSKIDVLIHPVAPGREGTSNVIMEALACGIPVVTTVNAGYHGEFLVDQRNALICDRDEEVFAEAIAALQRDERLRRRLSSEGRQFAERHHNLGTAATAYDAIAASLVAKRPPHAARHIKVSFAPFWEPMENFGSSRLRALYPSQYLSEAGRFEIVKGYAPDADVAIVTQMCSDPIYAQLMENKDQFVVYDVCDKYYENPRLFRHLDPPVNSIDRFAQLVDRADLIIVPTRELKAEIGSRYPHKPVKYIPEPVDYGTPARELRPYDNKVVLWFGNPDRGNWESAQPIIQRLRDAHGFTPLIVSRKSFFKAHPDFAPYVRDWSVVEMNRAFDEASICVVGYSEEEQAKSPNRMVTAVMHGLPTLATNSPAAREIYQETGHEFALIRNDGALDRAVARLENEEFRRLFVKRAQRYMTARYGVEAIRDTYTNLVDYQTYAKKRFAEAPRRIAFVSHNLALGEGAPWSLLELASGLKEKGVEPFVFSAGSGPLLQEYTKAGIEVKIFDAGSRHIAKVANNRFQALQTSFLEFLRENSIDAIIANTVKSSPFIHIAASVGVPGAVIVRESYALGERFEHFLGEAKLASMRGLTEAPEVVFVAQTSYETWADHPFRGHISVIPNGISPARFSDHDGVSKVDARAALQLPADDVIALCVGTINVRKGQAELARAFAELPEAVRQKTRIVFLGAVQNSHLDDFRAFLETLAPEVRERLIVAEATSDVGAYYAAADFFLMNSSSEAYPRSVVEGLYFGLPILSTAVFGVKEQVRSGESGYLYEFNDMGAWSGHFSTLVEDDALRERMSVQARRAFWKLEGYNEMLHSYKCVIDHLLTAKESEKGGK